ncbi:cytochrome d ubiquinol oxidase subunit II [Dyella sp. RRB7]|uniref:cytochrome d ubiquinol oxidase subunit II n=1 Tax=Dyella sp. RRB7 TaxID=2919502 RepID=UPI001FAA4328|nr:cytochrome d ubiquinol oxidase subunit II [Dyella sp. RRB7]
MGIDLPLVWMVIIGFGLMMYVIMDGFDLGIGMLLPLIRNREDRDRMVNTVAPVWDGNETWLVLGGAGLLAAFPTAYSILLSALYFPLILMLIGLILRGVAFEFRFKADDAHKPFWDRAFTWGSFIATLSQGIALGSIINGFTVSNLVFAGGAFDFLSPFSMFTGLCLLVAYALLGATWLVMKTDGFVQGQMRRAAQLLVVALLVAIAIVSVWTPLAHPGIARRWFSFPNIAFFSPVPILVLFTSWALVRSLRRDGQAKPFVLTLFLLFLGYTGLLISIWPNIVPPSVSFRDAAGPAQSMGFTLVGALLIIPFILTYSAWSYFVFRGKIGNDEGYH